MSPPSRSFWPGKCQTCTLEACGSIPARRGGGRVRGRGRGSIEGAHMPPRDLDGRYRRQVGSAPRASPPSRSFWPGVRMFQQQTVRGDIHCSQRSRTSIPCHSPRTRPRRPAGAPPSRRRPSAPARKRKGKEGNVATATRVLAHELVVDEQHAGAQLVAPVAASIRPPAARGRAAASSGLGVSLRPPTSPRALGRGRPLWETPGT